MAFDRQLADRLRTALGDVPDVREQRMFGGLAFLVEGHMACGVVGDDLMLRLGEQGADAALDEPHVRPMDFTGKPMRTMVFVSPLGTATDRASTPPPFSWPEEGARRAPAARVTRSRRTPSAPVAA